MNIHGLNQQGQSQRAIARELSLSRNTVAKHLQSSQLRIPAIPDTCSGLIRTR